MSHTQLTFGIHTIEALREANISFSIIEYPPKTPLFPQGVLTETVFLVASGLVKLAHVDSQGKETIVAVRRSGWLLGVAAAILNEPQPTAAVTVTHCRFLRISAREIREFVGAETRFGRHLHEVQAQGAHDHLLNVVEVVSHPTKYRLAKLLVELLLEEHPPQPVKRRNVRIPFKQWEIAELLAVSPEHTCRILRHLEQEGLVLRKNKVLFVPDPQKLLSFLDR